MNWIRANKFLSGFIAVMVVAVGVLGYFLYTAYSDFSQATNQYNQTADTLKALETRHPFPNEANLIQYKAQRDDLIAATHTLATKLAGMQLPIEDLSPSAFQDQLRDAVSAVNAQAAKDGVKLPSGFAMDFTRYQSEQPAPAAAGPLGRELAAIHEAVNTILDDRVESITSLTRDILPQESNAGRGSSAAASGARGAAATAPAATGGLVEKHPFEIKFTSTQQSFNKVINDLAASSKQFYITRSLVIANTGPNAISKEEAASAASSDQAATTGTDASVSGSGSTLSFVVGTEKLNIAMRVDIVSFNPPEQPSHKGGAAPR